MNKIWIIAIIVIIGALAAGIILRPIKPAAPPAKPVTAEDISRKADDLPPPITRTENQKVVVELETKEVVAEIAPGVTYEYWTYNGTVPGPFIRVKEGDDVEVRLTHALHSHASIKHSFDISVF